MKIPNTITKSKKLYHALEFTLVTLLVVFNAQAVPLSSSVQSIPASSIDFPAGVEVAKYPAKLKQYNTTSAKSFDVARAFGLSPSIRGDGGCGGDCCSGYTPGVCWGSCCTEDHPRCCGTDSCCPADYPVCTGDHKYCCQAVACQSTCCSAGSQCATDGGCCDPNSVVGIVEMSNFQYCMSQPNGGSCGTPLTDPTNYQGFMSLDTGATAGTVQLQWEAINTGSRDEPVGTANVQYSMTQSVSYTYDTSYSFTEGTKVTAEVPFFEKGEISFSSTQSFDHSDTHSNSFTLTLNYNPAQKTIAAFSKQYYQFNASLYAMTIPFTATATVKYACGNTKTITVTGSSKTSGVAGFATGSWTSWDGPVIPVECTGNGTQGVWCPGETNTCSSNPVCSRLAISEPGNLCCTTTSGSYLPCCAAAGGSKQCLDEGWSAETLLCPAPSGVFASCCCNNKPGFLD